MHPQITSELKQTLLSQLPSFLAAQRWFGGKARQISGVELIDTIPISGKEPKSTVLNIAVKYGDGKGETYSIPIITVRYGDYWYRVGFSLSVAVFHGNIQHGRLRL